MHADAELAQPGIADQFGAEQGSFSHIELRVMLTLRTHPNGFVKTEKKGVIVWNVSPSHFKRFVAR